MPSDTSLALPTYGWVRLVGSTASGNFSVRIPAALIDDKTEADTSDCVGYCYRRVVFGGRGLTVVWFGHTAAGNILIQGAAGAATLSAYTG